VSHSPRAIAALAAILLSFGATFALSACASPVTHDAGSGVAETQDGQPDNADPTSDGDDSTQPDTDGGDDSTQTHTDGGGDPAQDTVRTGPVAQYGGPAYGDQGDAEVIEPGLWCKTIAVFWGGSEPIPEGVRFAFETAVPDQPGLAVEPGICGSAGATTTCLGLTVEANQSGIFCSIQVRPDADFVDGTTISFTGTLSCPTSDVCDAVAARQVDPGPPIVVNTPDGE
jgi:hypothetical protein